MLEDKHVTISDVARAANVSRALVSFVLNGRKDVAPATRVRILQAIEDLGYRPNAIARNLARKQAGAIGIVCDMETYQDPLDMQFLAALLTIASEMKQRIMLVPADDHQIQEVVQERAVDSIIFLDERVADTRIVHALSMGIPALGLWGDDLDITLHKGIEELALHLESRGLQHVICLCETGDKLFVTKFEHQLTTILREYNITSAVHYCSSETEMGMIQHVMRELKPKSNSALIASSDRLAINAIHHLHALRLRVPDDYAVIGFGDIPASQWVQPALTTIRVPVKAIALRAVAEVFKHDETKQSLPQANCKLIVRRSC